MRTLDSTPEIQTRWLEVWRQRVETPSGQVVDDYYIARKSDFVMVLAITPEGEVILLFEWKQGAGTYVYNLVAGGVREGESPRRAAERELLEETGYEAGEMILLGSHFHVSSSWLKDKAHIFYAPNVRKVTEPRLEDTEDIEVNLLPFDQVVEMARTGQIQDPYSVLAIFWAKVEGWVEEIPRQGFGIRRL